MFKCFAEHQKMFGYINLVLISDRKLKRKSDSTKIVDLKYSKGFEKGIKNIDFLHFQPNPK